MRTTTIAMALSAIFALHGCGGGGGSNDDSAVSGDEPTTNPSPADPGTTDPGTTDPGTTDPGTTDPGTTDPEPTDPAPTDPGPTDPGPTDPGPTDPVPTDPGPTDPGPTDPGPTDPIPTDPGPTDPGPTDPPPPTSGADIDMARPFNQQVDCRFGLKPYYEPENSGAWTASFDGDTLTLLSGNGQQTRGGRFSTSGNPTERENYEGAALQRTYLGASGGEIYFTKTLTEEIIATGHNRMGGNSPNTSTVECGADTASQWIPIPEVRQFAADDSGVNFANMSSDMNCALRQGDSPWNAVVQTYLVTSDSGSLEMFYGGNNTIFEVADYYGTGRTVTMPVSSGVLAAGGLRVFYSKDAAGNNIEISLRYNNLVNYVRETQAGGLIANCVPYPLDPRY